MLSENVLSELQSADSILGSTARRGNHDRG